MFRHRSWLRMIDFKAGRRTLKARIPQIKLGRMTVHVLMTSVLSSSQLHFSGLLRSSHVSFAAEVISEGSGSALSALGLEMLKKAESEKKKGRGSSQLSRVSVTARGLHESVT